MPTLSGLRPADSVDAFFSVVSLVIMVGSGLAVYRQWRNDPHRRLRLLATSTIANAALGQPVKLVGKVGLSESPLTSPLSGTACVGYQLLVRLDTEEGGSLLDEELLLDFVLDDGTGMARVSVGANTHTLLADDRSWTVAAGEPLSAAMSELLARRRKSRPRSLPLLFVERLLVAGSTVSVRGRRRLEGEGHTYRGSTRRLVIEARDGEPLSICNYPTAQETYRR
jgi:hypothetical protein